MQNNSNFTLPELSDWHKKKFLASATQVLETQQQMTTRKGKNILHYTLQKKRRHVGMNHYPNDDRIDRATGAQYFYHCHREDFETTEHGHFHCFLRYKHIPKRIKPTSLEDWDRYIDNPMTHLIAIGMNQTGMPIRLFTVNRWVTSEIWYDAGHAPNFIKRFKMTKEDDPYWMVLDRWVEGILHLFSPQIIWLHQERDKIIQAQKLASPEENVYLNYDLEELSYIDVDLKKQIEWVISH
jgi:hypothetical protein